ncbi:MAG: chloride channel protein, partial [Verrucomicrobiaceae bacterium]
AMVVRALFGEAYPMLPLDVTGSPGAVMAVSSAVVGLSCGLVAVGITHALHGIEHLFEKLPVHWMWWPALGGLAVGVCGWIDPRTLGPGYPNLAALLEGHMAFGAIATLLLFKFLSWSICLGSGTSGGTVAPAMTIGGAVGGMVVMGLHQMEIFSQVPVGVAVLVGMAAVFAGISRAFLTSVAFGLEATHAAPAAGPLLVGCAVAVLVSKVCMRESMMTEKLARSGVRVPADYEPDLLHGLNVADAMLAEPRTVPPDMTVSALAGRISGNDPVWGAVRLFPIVGSGRELLGIISRADVLAAVAEAPESTVLEAGVVSPVTVHPHSSLSDAADRMILHAVGRLPVVDDTQPPRLCGLLTRRGVLQARQHRIDAEKRG